MKKYFELLRVRHYVKNLLVFATLICGGRLFDFDLLISNLLGFFSFCLIASIVYIVNDIVDVGKDREHPRKKDRPIASGEISVKQALVVIVIMLGFEILLGVIINACSTTCQFFLVSTLYKFQHEFMLCAP